MKVSIKTRAFGYKSQDETIVDFSFRFVTEPNDFAPDLLGDTLERIDFDLFEIQGLDRLAGCFVNDGLTEDAARACVRQHLESLVRQHIRGFDSFGLIKKVGE